jgi:hypothetical protein
MTLPEQAEAMADRLTNRAFRLATRDFNGDGAKLANDAAALIRRMIARMRQDAEYVDVGRIGKV